MKCVRIKLSFEEWSSSYDVCKSIIRYINVFRFNMFMIETKMEF